MDSILFLVIALAINLVIKSANDKKKIEEARRKRAEQLKNNPMGSSDRMEKWNKESERKTRNIVQEFDLSPTKDIRQKSKQEVKPKVPVDSPSYVKRMESERIQTKDLEIDIIKDNKKKIRKKELLNAIIWSEILGEPKSVQNIKRGM